MTSHPPDPKDVHDERRAAPLRGRLAHHLKGFQQFAWERQALARCSCSQLARHVRRLQHARTQGDGRDDPRSRIGARARLRIKVYPSTSVMPMSLTIASKRPRVRSASCALLAVVNARPVIFEHQARELERIRFVIYDQERCGRCSAEIPAPVSSATIAVPDSASLRCAPFRPTRERMPLGRFFSEAAESASTGAMGRSRKRPTTASHRSS